MTGGDSDQLEDLEQSMRKMAHAQRDAGDVAGAIASLVDAIGILEQLVRSNPNDRKRPIWQHSLFMSHLDAGELQREHGDLSGALASFRAAFAVREQLPQTCPDDHGNNDWWQHLSAIRDERSASAYENAGEILKAQGDFAGALASYRDALAIRQRLAQSNPRSGRLQLKLSVCLDTIADFHLERGNQSEALTAYRDSLGIVERMAKSGATEIDSDFSEGDRSYRIDWQWAFGDSNQRIGYALSVTGDIPGAVKYYRDALAAKEIAAKANGGDGGRQHEVARIYGAIGELQSQQGDPTGAVKHYQGGFAILDRLNRSDPANAQWQGDLVQFCIKLSDLEPSQAKTLLNRASEIIRNMQSRGVLPDSDAWIPGELARRIAALPRRWSLFG